MRKITFKIKRFDGVDSWVQEYQFAYQPNKTLLWALSEIKETLDPSLSFTAACRHSICGACAVRVHGQATLACETTLDSLFKRWNSDTLFLEPLQNFPVIRDLVVDWEPKVDRIKKVKPWLIPKDEYTKETGCRQSPQEFKQINKNSDCIMCGCCASECSKLSTNGENFLEPFIFSKAQKFVADSRDQASLDRIIAAINHGAWMCQHCQECVTKCPKGISSAEDISQLRQGAIIQGMTDNEGPRHAKAFLDDIQHTGRLNEAMMALKTEGLVKTMGNIPYALRLFMKGKIQPAHLFPKPIDGVEEVRALIKSVKDAEAKGKVAKGNRGGAA